MRLETGLLERDAELRDLDRLIDGACAGDGCLVVIQGSPGIGKTRLIAAAREQTRATGMAVLRARGRELEQTFAFGIVRQLFEPALSRLGSDERLEVMDGAAGLAAPLFDERSLAQPSPPAEESLFAVVHGLYWLTANLAQREPLLLEIDDLHWADASSLRWLAYLATRLDGLPVLVVAGLRSSEPEGEGTLLDQALRDARHVLRPAPLSRDAAALVVRDRFHAADDEFVAACHAASAGNPLFLGELVLALAAEGGAPDVSRVWEIAPDPVARSVRLRLSRLPAEATTLARAVSILGDGAAISDAAALASLELLVAADAAAALQKADILKEETALSFVHPIVRTVVYNGIAPSERLLSHRRAAELLSSGKAPAERVAAQLLLAPAAGDERTVEILRRASERALARGAPDDAIAYLRRALAEPAPKHQRGELLLELGLAEAPVHAVDTRRHLNEALLTLDRPSARARAAEELARQHIWHHRVQEGIEFLEQAISECGSEHADLRGQLTAELIHIGLADASYYPLARRRLTRLEETLSEADLGQRMLLAVRAWHEAHRGVSIEDAITLASKALAEGIGQPNERSFTLWAAVRTLAAADQLDRAEEHFRAGLAHARESGSARAFAIGCFSFAEVQLARGALAEAEAEARIGLDAALAHDWPLIVPFAAASLVDALVERNEAAEAEAVLSGAGLAGALPAVPTFVTAGMARGRLRSLKGSFQEGVDDFLWCGQMLDGVGAQNPAIASWRSEAALALLALGQRPQARRLVEEEVELAHAWGAPRALGRALRAAGLVEGGEHGLGRLREAVTVLDDSPARLERARALTDLGAALRRANSRTEAREFLRRGLDLAQRCGARRLADQAHEELVATGARPRRVALSGVDALTPSERRVASMAAEGMTNRDIAQALFVTLKTVEVHLRHAYQKLDITSRSQLAQALSTATASEVQPSAAVTAITDSG